MRRVVHLIDAGMVAGEIDFIPDTDHRDIVGKTRDDGFIGAGRSAAGIEQMQDHIGLFHFSPGARDADAFDRIDHIGLFAVFRFILLVTDTGGVDDIERNALDMDGLGDLVARGAGDRRNDRDIITRQGIEQRRFTDIRLARQHDI